MAKGKTSLPDVLKAAADCRTSSLKLAGMEYAKELSDNLLKQAEELEKHYKLLSKHVHDGAEKEVKLVLATTGARLAAVEQAQAWHSSLTCLFVPNCCLPPPPHQNYSERLFSFIVSHGFRRGCAHTANC